jgi:hypothetical protein
MCSGGCNKVLGWLSPWQALDREPAAGHELVETTAPG